MSTDPRFDALRARLLPWPRPGAWIALLIRAFPQPGDADGPPHWLVAGWRADEDGLVPRLPEFAAIASPDRERALAELFVHLPPDAPVHLTTPERVDAALVAEMVLEVDRTLQPWHRAGLRAFVDAHREADRARIRARYTDREEGWERMRAGLLGGAALAPAGAGPAAHAGALDESDDGHGGPGGHDGAAGGGGAAGGVGDGPGGDGGGPGGAGGGPGGAGDGGGSGGD